MALGTWDSQDWIHKLVGRSKEGKARLNPDHRIKFGALALSLSLSPPPPCLISSWVDLVPIPGQGKRGVRADN